MPRTNKLPLRTMSPIPFLPPHHQRPKYTHVYHNLLRKHPFTRIKENQQISTSTSYQGEDLHCITDVHISRGSTRHISPSPLLHWQISNPPVGTPLSAALPPRSHCQTPSKPRRQRPCGSLNSVVKKSDRMEGILRTFFSGWDTVSWNRCLRRAELDCEQVYRSILPLACRCVRRLTL
jgi:hypothetical protein